MKRSAPQRKAPMKRGKPLARQRSKKKKYSPKVNTFPEEIRQMARRRSNGICEVGTSKCTGKAAHFHHRKLKRWGDHSLANCLHVCTACHVHIHDNVGPSKLMGWIVPSFVAPVDVDVRKGDRWRMHH